MFEVTTLLYLYDTIVSEKVRKHGIDKLSRFIDGRMCEKASYFKENNTLVQTYNYLKNVLTIYAIKHIISEQSKSFAFVKVTLLTLL